MKINHVIFAISIALALGACSDNAFVPTMDDEPTKLSASQSIQRSEDEAMAYAAEFLNSFPHKESRSLPDIKIHALTNKSSRSAAAVDTLLYIAQYGENQGYAIISGSRELSPVLAYVEEGNFFDIENVNNGGFQMYMEAASDYVENSMRRSSLIERPVIPAFNDWTIHYNDTIAPRLKVAWSQEYPEGYFCPNRISGCVITAVAQILSYYEAPTELSLTYPNHPIAKVQFDWSEIKKHKTSYTADWVDYPWAISTHMATCQASEEAHVALAYLCRELGHRSHATYNSRETNKGTGASMQNAQKTASAIRNQNKYEYNLTAVCEYSKARFLLDHIKEGVVLMSGFVTPTSDGHAWVADGGLKVGTVRTHVDYGMGLDGSDVVTVTENLDMLVHFNWGWGGYGNGYFNPEVFNPEDADSYDFMSSGMNKDYKYNLKYIAFYKEQMAIL